MSTLDTTKSLSLSVYPNAPFCERPSHQSTLDLLLLCCLVDFGSVSFSTAPLAPSTTLLLCAQTFLCAVCINLYIQEWHLMLVNCSGLLVFVPQISNCCFSEQDRIPLQHRMSRPTTKSAQTLEYLQLFRANSSRSVMIRDLPFSCANEDVFNLCEDILGIRPSLVHVIFDTKGCPLHYGYILFESDDDAHQAIAKMDRLRFRGRDIRYEHCWDDWRICKDRLFTTSVWTDLFRSTPLGATKKVDRVQFTSTSERKALCRHPSQRRPSVDFWKRMASWNMWSFAHMVIARR